MKFISFLFFLCTSVYLKANDSLVFTATVKVRDIHTRQAIPDVSVCLHNEKGELCWKGCTDTSGAVFIEKGTILPNRHYHVHIEHPAYYYDPVGVEISTDTLHFSQDFVLDMAFLPMKHFALTGCVVWDSLKTPANLEAFVTEWKYWKSIYELEYGLGQGIATLYVHMSSDAYHKVVRRISKKLIRLYRRKYPEDAIRRKPVYHYLKTHEHACCILPGVVSKDALISKKKEN